MNLSRVGRVVVPLLVVAAASFGLAACSSSSAGAMTLEPASNAGTDPFSASVQIGPAVSFPGNVAAITATARKTRTADTKTHTLVASGTAPGLYGGTGNAHVCNADQLVAFLTEHADKAAAWASVLGIEPANIKSYVASLTPVVLTADTLVTNHGFRNGRATTLQSVLQAGTAVMVDTTGTPRVKCNCGNPLTPPEPISVTSAHTNGSPWPGYAPTQITTVQSGTSTNKLTLIDIGTGDTYTVPTGSSAGVWVAADATPYGNTSTILTSVDGSTWSTVSTIPGVAVSAIAFGNGTWIAAADTQQDPQSGSQILRSTDLKTWTKVDDNLAHIGGVAYGAGRWVAVGASVAGVAVGGLDHATRVEYSSTDGSHWSEVDISSLGTNDANMQRLQSVTYADGKWIAAGLDERDDRTGQTSPSLTLKTFTSSDGTRWTPDAHWSSNVSLAEAGGATATVVHGADKSVAGSSTLGGGAMLHFRPDGATWIDLPGTKFTQHTLQAMAYGNGSYLAAAVAAGPNGAVASSSTFYTSADAATWKAVNNRTSFIAALAYGPAPSTTAAPVSSPTCRNEFMWPAIKKVIAPTATPLLNTVQAHCSGEWGYVTFKLSGGVDVLTLVVHWDATTKEWEPAQDACAQHQVPADIQGAACSGTAPGASPTTTVPASGSAPSCTIATFQQLVNSGATVSTVWCNSGWAVVNSRSADSEDVVAYRWNGTTWKVVQQFACDIPIPGLPQALHDKVCNHG